MKPGKTSPPARYTEATLLSAMEHPSGQVSDQNLSRILEETGGLGTPATRADIIEKLFSTFYVERRGKELVPTSKGMQVVDLAPEELRICRPHRPVGAAAWGTLRRGREQESAFVDEMRQICRPAGGRGEGQRRGLPPRQPDPHPLSRTAASTCCGSRASGGEMLVCPDRECGYRRSVKPDHQRPLPQLPQEDGAAGRGGKAAVRLRVRLSGEAVRLQEAAGPEAGAGKRDVRKYLANRSTSSRNTAMADALAKWKAAQEAKDK